MEFKNEIDVISNDSSATEEERMLLYWLIRAMKPTNVVEIGTHRGLTTLYLAHAVRDNKVGHVWTCDPDESFRQVENFEHFPKLKEFLTFEKVRGVDISVQIIDFMFIDGDHYKESVVEEIKALFPRLSKNAVVVFHDCWDTKVEAVNHAIAECGLDTVWLPTNWALRIYQNNKELLNERHLNYGNLPAKPV